MAKYIENFDKKFLVDFPFSIRRNQALPLDSTSLHLTLDDAKEYAKNNSLAYVGQILTVYSEDKTAIYFIKNQEGDLEKLPDFSDLNLESDDLNEKIKEILDKISELNDGDNSVNTNIENIQKELSANKEKIEENSGKITDLEKSVTETIDAHNAEVADKLRSINVDITGVKDEISTLDKSFAESQEAQNETLKSEISRVEEKISEIDTKCDNIEQKLSENIETLSSTNDSRFKNIEVDIVDIKTEVNESSFLINDKFNSVYSTIKTSIDDTYNKLSAVDSEIKEEIQNSIKSIEESLTELGVKTSNDKAQLNGTIAIESRNLAQEINILRNDLGNVNTNLTKEIDKINAKKTISEYGIIDAYTKNENVEMIERYIAIVDKKIDNINAETTDSIMQKEEKLQNQIDKINAKETLADYKLDDEVYNKTEIDSFLVDAKNYTKSEINSVEADLADTNTRLSTAISDLGNLSENADSRLSVLENKNTLADYKLDDEVYNKKEIDGRFDSVNIDLADLTLDVNANLGNLSADIRDLDDKLNITISNINSDISDLTNEISAVRTDVDRKYGNLSTEITDLKNTVDIKISSQLSQIDGGASSEYKSLKKIEDKIISLNKNKQEKLTAGENIKIVDNVISAVISVDDIPDLDLKGYISVEEFNAFAPTKQDTLISGTNIKTLNNESLLGEGNIDLQLNFDRLNNVPETLVVSTEISGNTLTITDHAGNVSEFKGVTDYKDLTNTPTKVSEFENDAFYVNNTEAKEIAANELDRLTSESSGALETFKELIDMIENDETGITALINKIDEHGDTIDNHEDRIIELEENNGNFAALQEYIKVNDENIGKINENLDSLNTTAEKVEAFLLDADLSESAKDTLKELQNYMESDTTAAAQMAENISKNTTDIQEINDKIENFDFEVDLSDYYNKTETGAKFAEKGKVSEDYNTLEKIENILVDKVGMTEVQSTAKKLENTLDAKITTLKNLHGLNENNETLAVADEALKIVEAYFAAFFGDNGSESEVHLDGGRISK